jgi:hypothetical protein
VNPVSWGKQTRGTHPTSDSVSPAPLDMLHIDVLEMPVLSRQHFNYLLGVVDDHSRSACVAGLKTNGAAADNLRALILRVENRESSRSRLCGPTWVGSSLEATCKDGSENGEENTKQLQGVLHSQTDVLRGSCAHYKMAFV